MAPKNSRIISIDRDQDYLIDVSYIFEKTRYALPLFYFNTYNRGLYLKFTDFLVDSP